MLYHINDNIDIYIVSVSDNDKFGYFIFTKEILREKNIISSDNNIGNLVFRVYAPWYNADNETTKTTQLWQLQYFVDTEHGKIQNNKVCTYMM